MARIGFERLAHAYPGGGGYALKPMDMVWEDAGAYALLGPSGCGKTTLLNIVSGLLRPSEGRVLFGAADVTALPTERRNVAQVFQFPVVYDTMTVRENLAFPLRNRGVPAAAARGRVEYVARLLGLTRDLDRPARNLGADEKQKISLGRGLVRNDVAAILFDEPLTVIDPNLKWELRSRLKELHREVPVTMIYVTHDQTEALTFADRVAVMSEGEVVQMGTPEALFERPAHTFVGHFIGSPGMNLLPCAVEGRQALLPGGLHVTLPHAYPALSGQVELGIRPEFATLADEGLPVTIRRLEDLGRRRIARLELAGRPFAATLPEGMPVPAEPRLLLQPAQLHVYAGGRLMPGEA
ncbi:ABC transporter ATP-binding protein [Pseudoroseomonas ludipueritiae]|uniref:ABC transporter ATP-binding protein n=1 Tax=Pseudoroseomonas ludipueritiae TaxID=198093 RepID=A0ABR7R4H0_9PROT|nr:ABC transporter ATP-binding protein [Pseudoroseomonas ludipueritiae]MBC9176675.1 ABC transporter ATP-binding protein [Pseudoroseomonas ludipueritiae]